MSQLFDYFVCSRPMIERWADALEQQDEILQHTIEAEMPRFISLNNVGQDDLNILAHCVGGNKVNTVKAVGEVDLVKIISEEGRWVTAFRQPAVDAIARMVIDQSLLQHWVQNVSRYNGRSEDFLRKILTADIAEA